MRFPEFSGEWDRFRNCALFKVISEKNKNYEFSTVLSASQTEGMVLRESLGIDIKFEEDSIKTYKIVRNGDYIAHLRSFQGGFAFSDKTGVCSPAYTILRPSETISYGFLKPYFMSRKFIDSLRIVTYGIRDGKSISVDEWLKLYTSIPKVNEQEKISKFLKLINERIETQKKIIEELKKLKYAICQRLFTELGQQHPAVKLRQLCSIKTGKLDANAMTDNGEFPFFTCAREDYRTDTYAFEGDSLLISGNGDIGIVKRYNGKFNAYQRTYVLQNFKESIDYIKCYIEHYLPKRVLKEKNVGAMPYIVLSTLADMPITLPSANTQAKIYNTVGAVTELINIEEDMLSNYELQKQHCLSLMFI